MTKKWSDIERDKDYISATESQKQAIADGFFNDIIKPDIPSGQDVEAIKSRFMSTARPPKPSVMERISAGLSDLVTPRTVVNPQKAAKPSTFKQDTQATDRLLPTVAADRVKEGQSRVIGQLVQQGYEPREAAEQALQIDADRVDKLNQDAVKPVDMSYAGPMREKPKRSLGDYFKDTAGSVIKIPGAMVRDVANIGNMVTGDSMPTDVAGTMQRGMDEFDRRYGSDARQFENSEFSRIAQDPDQDFTSQVDYLLENPTFLADQGITTVGSMFLPAGASAGAMKVLTKLTGGKVPPGIANALRSGTIAGTVAMQNAAETFNDPDMQDVPLEVRYEAAAITALGTLLGNKIFGGGVERAIADKFNKSGAAQGFALAAKEGGQEAFESLSQSSGKAVALPGSVTLNEAMGGALMEGAMGAVMGGGAAAVGMSGNSDNRPVDETINTSAGTIGVQSKGQQIIDFLKRKTGTAKPTQDAPQNIIKPQDLGAATQASQTLSASDLLEEDNVSDATQGPTAGLDDRGSGAQPDIGNASAGDLSVLPDPGQDRAGAFSGAGENSARNEFDLDAGNGNIEQPANLIDQQANEAATSVQNDLPEPTQAQKDAGNYKVGRIKVGGLDISVENPDQSARKGVDPDGKAWESTMNGHYGYVKGVKARAPDKEHIDVNVKAGTADSYSGDVFVINQKDPKTGKFDEPKVYIGYGNENEAEQAYRSNYAQDWQGFGDMVRLPMSKFKEMLGNEKAFLKPVKPQKKPKPRASKRANTLLSAIDSLGGIDNKYKWDISGEQKFARAGYNKIFRTASTKTLEQHIENGDLDEFLPHEFRSTATDDPTAGRNYLADRIRNGDRVIPYDDQLRIDQERRDNRIDDDALDAIASMPEVGMFINDDDDIGFGIGVELTPEESEAYWGAIDEGYDTAASSEQTEQPVAGDPPGSSVSDNEAPQKPASQNEIAGKTGSQERQGVREIVTAIVKRRAAANQIGKEKAFDGYLAAAKEFLNGKDIKPTEFKVASATFKNDPPLSEAFAQLAEIAKAPAKEARKNMRSAVDIFTEQINNAKTTEELRSIARNIQLETGVLSDSAAQQLDDLVMTRIDEIAEPEVEIAQEANAEPIEPSPLELAGETNEEILAREQAQREAEQAAEREAARAKAERERADAKRRVEAQAGNVDNFVMGESSREAAKPQRDIFGGNNPTVTMPVQGKQEPKEIVKSRPQPGQEGYTLQMAREDLGDLLDEQRRNDMVGDARLDDRITRMKQLVQQLSQDAATPEAAIDETSKAKEAPGTRTNGATEKAVAEELIALEKAIEATNDMRFSKRGEPYTNAKQVIKTVISELLKPKTTTGIEGLLEQASRQLKKGYGEFSEVIDKANAKLKGEDQNSKKSRFANNKVFTADKVEAARARLKSKLNTINSGIDPELLVDGMTIAGAYIESGVRSFADYSKAMVGDFGESIKPYLLSFYEAARAYPGIDKEGMSSVETASAEYIKLITPEVKEATKEAIGVVNTKKTTRKVKAAPEDKYGTQLNQDWRVSSINGYGEEDVAAGYTDLSFNEGGAKGGVKDAFISDSKKFLSNLASIMQENGYMPHLDNKGKPEKPVSVNEGGRAVSGDITMTITKGQANIYVHISEGALRGLTSSHPQGVSIMARVSNSSGDKFANKGQNTWLNTTLSVGEVYNKIDAMTERALQGVQNQNDYVKTTEPTKEVTQNARITEAGNVPDRVAQANLFAEQSGGSDSEPVVSGVAGQSASPDTNESVSGGVPAAGTERAKRTSRPATAAAPGGPRKATDAGNQAGSTSSVDNFEITDEVDLGAGGLTRKYRDNIDAIKIIKALDSEGRTATPEERLKLAKYAGFGALKGVFDKANKQWAKQYQELKELLTDSEYESARASVLNAHYTSKEVVNTMFDVLRRLGFDGGRMLEPALGSGNFFGLMPASIRNKSQLNGVELDLLTSRLAKHLYPKANIAVATGFQDYVSPSGYFDVVIGNPPFGSEKVFDSQKSPYSGFSIHNYFLAKSIDKLREGGIMAVVVSHNFMDVNASPARDYIAKHANLLGAIRLPDTAFQQNAGTEVVTDIVFFQKTSNPEKDPDWLNSRETEITNPKTGEVSKAFVNDYFLGNPRMVLGRHSAAGTMYRGNNYTVEQTGDVAKMLKEAVQNLPVNKYVEPTQRIEVLDSADNTVPDGVKVGTYYADESGVIRQRLTDLLGQKRSQEWQAPNNGAIERMKAMMTLRDTLRTQMRLERDYQSSVDQIETNRKALNRRYDDFLKKFSYLNSSTNRRIFLDDTESALLQALELDYDQGVSKAKATNTGMEERPASAQKADIFKQRVLFPPSETISVSTAKDALLASLNEKGRVDIDFIADVYGKSVNEVVKELGDLVYEDPQAGYVAADEYLSGDVKTKLEEAKAAAKDDQKFKRSVEALEKVIPKDKLPSEIYVSVGANFVPAEIYAEFVSEITGVPANKLNFTYVKATANWLSVNNGSGDAGKLTSDYGTDKINSFELFALMMNGKSPEIKYTVRLPGGTTETRTDVEGTEAARAKYQKIKETWESWVFAEPSRADRLSGIYNEKHNRIVARKYDGSHMTFPGMNPAIQLRPSQKNVVWRGIQDRNVLLDHVVGAGKTMAMASIAMEMKRLGISRKPIFAVPNHLTLQWRSEFTRLYPASNVLAATPEDFSKDKRERLFSKMVTGNYDAIIIGHSSLKKIGLPADVEERLYNDQINEIASAIEDMKRDRGDRSIIRDMEKIRTNLENKVKDLASKAGKRDDVVNFDEIGIDALFVDEMHEFKNLFFTTQMQRVSGLGNPKGSGKAFDMFMKIRWMNEAFGENAALISATGTPVSNSLSEMFTMQRYHKYDQMKRDDLHLFDAWAKQYGEVENVYEVAPSGVGYRQSTRFSKFKNLPSLMGSYTGFADIVTLQDLKDNASAAGLTFPVPKLRTGKPINVVAERSALQTAFFGVPKLATNESGDIQFEIEPENISIEQVEDKWQMLDKTSSAFIGEKYPTKEDAELDLVTKALTPKTFLDPESLLGKFANLRQLTRETKGKVNALSLTGLANKSGLDYRLIDPTAPDFAGSKINKAVDNMLADYKLWEKDKGTQIVFCDMSIPLSARNDMGSKEKRVYVRDRDNSITHKPKGVIYAVEGFEGFPFYLVKERDGIDVYEPVSGQIVTSRRFADKSEAKAYINSMVEADSFADRIYSMRDQLSIDQAEIDEYRDAKELEVADDFSNEVTMTDLEAVAGSAQFSVYDDIKAKLMRKGIPENEIAFIHDFSTPKQKEDLFKRVNRGDVRFLFGSTPKLGAGTNVQQRLIGLHHIDAPWRPSDLEQREGRIIRQGNKLYERDPDGFEVAVYRYATEQTYDTRRWQLLEHKAAGIEQLRKYTGESEIEDVASEAANSADMKAAASGNPLILEETQLRTDKKRLENLQRAFSDSKLAMQRRITSNRISVEQSLPERIAHYEQMNRLAEQFPVPEDKGSTAKFKIEGREITNKDKAEEALAFLSARVRQSYNEREEKSFTYRGIEFVMERGWELGMMRLSAGDSHINTYLAKDKISPSGMITRLNNYIDSFSGRIAQFQAESVKLKAEAESLALRLDDPFEQAAELDDVRQKHVDVQRRLMKSTQLDAIPEEQLGAFKRILATRKQALKELGYATALKESERDSPSFSRNVGNLAAQSEIDAVAKLFKEMGSDSAVIKSLANKKAKKHPKAEEISNVENNFYDMLGQLEDSGLIKINC